MSGKATINLIEAGKFAWLDNVASLPSDENGVAVFENLSVVGSTADNIYIYFTCDALTTAFWGI